ncbi:hypothetical protein [Actinopolyspora erythraea]|uniref:hypothetical protein n=1 Tax=Actinopolyspora erythraea TaxID=414996 RepID=UPI000A4E1E6A|nr:hypothetical protein [Actinopolyspora erythraea]
MSTTDSLPPGADSTLLDALIERVRVGTTGPTAENATASVAFRTEQSARHAGRSTGYVNSVLSIRVDDAIGSCATEPGELDASLLPEIAGSSVAELLAHPEKPVRVAALDAYLTRNRPHETHPSVRTARIPAGSSLRKSTERARVVVELLPRGTSGPVAVIGVVNSLLAALHRRGLDYVACDLKGGRTEWDEPVLSDHTRALDGAGAVLASGMVLGNGTFDEIAAHCRAKDIPLVVFAQTGGAVFRELLGTEVTALSAEPYPFFWLTGETSDIHTYPAEKPARDDRSPVEDGPNRHRRTTNPTDGGVT